MRHLITGGAGFIGSHLTGRLLASGHSVVVLDNFNKYYSPRLKERNLAPYEDSQMLEVIRGSILDPPTVESAVSGVDTVIHLAAQAGVRYSMPVSQPSRPNEVMKNNYSGTINLINASLKEDLDRFVFASSSSVYGDVDLPACENSPTCPVSFYGVSKLATEHAIRLYHDHYQLPAVTLRYFSVYGPRQRPDMAISKFTHMILQEEPIPIYGDGKQRRDFTFVDDVVDATILAAQHNEAEGEIFNVGGGHGVSVNELVQVLSSVLKEKVGKKSHVEYVAWEKGDVQDTLSDCSKIARKLGWSPRTSLKQGIRRYVDWVLNEGGG